MNTYKLTSRTRTAISTLIYSLTSTIHTETRDRTVGRRINETSFTIEYNGISYNFADIYDWYTEECDVYNNDLEYDTSEITKYVTRESLKQLIDVLHDQLSGDDLLEVYFYKKYNVYRWKQDTKGHYRNFTVREDVTLSKEQLEKLKRWSRNCPLDY